MTLALSTERPDPNVCPIADAQIVTVTENSPQDLQPLYDREVDIEAETTVNPVNTACPYDPDKDPDTPPTPPEDDPEPEPEPETIHVTVTAGSANICHNATELPELTQFVSPEIPGGSLGSPTVPGWSPGTHDPDEVFPIIPGTWTPPDDGNNYEVHYDYGTLTVIHCAEDIEISVTADDVAVCIFSDGETTPFDLTQTVNPPEYADYFSDPTVIWDGSTGEFIITPGTLISNPNDVDNFIVIPHDGTLTVTHCNPKYYIDIDAQVCPTQLTNSSSKHYIANNSSGTIFIEQGQNNQFDTEQTQIVECVLAAKIIPITEEGNNETAELQIDYEIDKGQGHEKVTGSTTIIVESWYVLNVVINDLFPLSDYRQAIKNAETNGGTWSESVSVTIRATITDNQNNNHEKIFTLTPTLTLCPLTHVMENNFIRCHHRWTPGGTESTLWAGTATVE